MLIAFAILTSFSTLLGAAAAIRPLSDASHRRPGASRLLILLTAVVLIVLSILG